ncbi:unnamed protein product [Fusarium fujikuroi]|nr:uncharacterized protein FFC1_04053 [Fusarium fujikuroi]VTT74483.1 unnamed protein product [Fusarium fujikuroi]
MPTAISKPVMAPHDPVPFIIPQELLSAVPTISSRLVRLPTELLLILFSHVTDPIDQLCLALTCRRLLQISSFLVVKIPSVSKHRYLPPPFCDRMFMLMRRLAPSGALGRRQKRTLALCCDCLRYQPTKKSYWKKDEKRYTAVMRK